MQTSDQSPEEQSAQNQPAADSESEAPQNLRAVQDHTLEEKDVTGTNDIDDDAIRQGRIYPPPPAFYQKEAAPPLVRADTSKEAQPVPVQNQAQEPPSTYRGQTEYVPLPPAGNPQIPPYPFQPGYPSYSPGQNYPGSYPPYVPVAKKSYRWVWILVSVLSVIVIASCGICVWASSSIFGSAFQQASSAVYGGRDLTNNYYEAIQNKRYSQAYDYLYPQKQLKGLTQRQYLEQAQSLDTQYGPVYKYAAGTPSINYDTTGSTIDHFTIQVDVTREKKSYQVVLTMYKVGNQWKITDYTTI